MKRIIQSNKVINSSQIVNNNFPNKDIKVKTNLYKFVESKLLPNLMVCLSSGVIYFAFKNYMKKVQTEHTITLFKPAFIFTFCVCPILISGYFTKLDYDFFKEQLNN